MAPFLVRRATQGDAAAIARVHTQSWRETYSGLIPEVSLEQATNSQAYERRKESWRAALRGEEQDVFVAAQGGEVVAFASVGPARDHPGYAHELTTLYSLRRVQGQGIGRALLHAVMNQVQVKGSHTLALWVLSSNPTRQWYAAQGAREAGQKVEGGLTETRMVWDALPSSQAEP
ncbi:N-acetyltransferase [Deinococcus piscis]|uniref:N-acetyltransferase n=1 Tax=Deinococcus piscis TaxID=394230 RepID=A0ABQ3KBW9_9DEIO|nr:GNAT family N-acetyltransferase [Deinococcus piscis]GHG10374.1 N-acetyltransferase [Deinococcus piscis]